MAPASITVVNRQRARRVDLPGLRRFAARALPLVLANPGNHARDLAALEDIAVVLVSDSRMIRLHRTFMGLDGPADVLTFQHGEIAISVETADRARASYRNSLDAEIRIYLVHGLLHLNGHDDHDPREAAAMRRLQQKIVRAAGASGPL